MTLATAGFEAKLAYWKGAQDHLDLGALEERFKVLVEMATDGLWIVDIHTTRVLYANPACATLFGYTAEEFEGMSVLNLHPPEVVESVGELFQKVVEGANVEPVELWGLTKNGDQVCLEIKPSIIELRGAKFMMGVARDITERHKAEQDRQQLVTMIQNSDDIISIINLEGRPIFMNETGLRIVGCDSIEEASRHLVHEFHPEEVWDTVANEVLPTVVESGHWAGDLPLRNISTGALVPAHFHVFAIKNSSTGEPLAIATIARDLTERKQLEEQLLQSQKVESIGQLAGGIAHDFNNLLTPILGYVDMAVAKLSPEDPVSPFLEEIKKSSERASNLTHQLLAFARRQIIEPTVFNLNDLVIDTDKLLRRLIGVDIELVTLPMTDLGLIKADTGQLEQVLVNLAVNARDAMPKGGKLAISTRNVTVGSSPRTQSVSIKPGQYVTLTVSDTGSGMTDEVKARVFEPFFTTKDVGKGTGLGLATCYGVITQNGGQINLESKPGEGTTFTIYLPRVEGEPTQVPVAQELVDFPGGTETLLLVEDEDSVRKFAASLLTERGYTVLAASNGVEGSKLIQNCPHDVIDLLITDVVMPLMGGTELAEHVRTLYPDIKVLYTSGYTDDAIIHHEVINPGVQFLAKPFSAAGLLHKTREVIGG